MSSYDASEHSTESAPAADSEREIYSEEDAVDDHSSEASIEKHDPPPPQRKETPAPVYAAAAPKYVIPSSKSILKKRTHPEDSTSDTTKSNRARPANPPLMSTRSKDIATQVNIRRILSVFPPTEVLEETQLNFILRRLGVSKPSQITKVRNTCSLGDDRYDSQKLKDLMISALTNEGTPLAKSLHRGVINSLANERAKNGGGPTSPKPTQHQPLRTKMATKKRTDDDQRKPGYLPNFYDKEDPTPQPQKRQPIRRMGLTSNTVERTWHH